jgi:hypothetical protein
MASRVPKKWRIATEATLPTLLDYSSTLVLITRRTSISSSASMRRTFHRTLTLGSTRLNQHHASSIKPSRLNGSLRRSRISTWTYCTRSSDCDVCLLRRLHADVTNISITTRLYQFHSHLNTNGEVTHFADAIDNFLESLDASYCPQNETNPDRKCGVFPAAKVTSISYGAGEIFFPKAMQERQCNEFMKLALQGHTFAVASGDYGVESQPINYANLSTGCIVSGNYNASTGHGRGATQNGTVFSPGYPQNCPYVLSVGGTQLNPGETVDDAECAMNLRKYSLLGVATFSSSG